MDVALPPELESYVAEQIRNGRFESASELVEHALRLRIAEDAKEAEYFRKKIRRSEEDFAAGRFVVADDAFFDSLRERIRVNAGPAAAERADAGADAAGKE